MNEKRHEFETGEIRVTWSKARCIHAAECVRRLGAVFRPGERPWIQLEHASADRIAEVVERCPTGALLFERKDGGAAEARPATNTVLVTRNGPTYVRGDVELCAPGGEVIWRGTRLALCRCGLSKNKPFCDNAHLAAGFRDDGAIADLDGVQDPGASGNALRLIPEPNGPVQLDGPFALGSADGRTIVPGTSTWLCRCGQSKNKPFCDGSHETTGFRSE